MEKINFIQSHLITKIRSRVELIFKNEKYFGFLWLDKPVYDKRFVINRIGVTCPFQLEEVMPLSWYSLEAKTLLKIYKAMKNNEIYIQVKNNDYSLNLKPNEII